MRAFCHILSLFFITLFCSITVFAQGLGAPESMNYQAVIRDGSGNVLSNQTVSLRIKILQGSASGSPVYVETFAPTTNAYGSIAIQIGNGTVITGTFNTIDWGANSYFVETAVDISGWSNYTVISTTQLMSVPYALYAKTAGNAVWQQDANNDINFGQGNARFWETTEGYRLSITGGTPLILKRNKSISNYGVPINFNLLNSSNQDTRYGQVVSSIRDNTAGAELGSLSFLVADGSGTWSNAYAEERLRIETDRVTVKTVMNLEPLISMPSSSSKGDMYYDNTANQLKVFNGSSWDNLGGSPSPWTESGSNVYRNSGNVGIGTTTPTSLLQISDINAEGPTFKIDGLSPSVLFQDNSGVSNTVDNFEIRNNLGSLSFNYGDNSDANDDGFLSNIALSISNNGTTRVTNLAGSGDRMVVADSDGDLSTQAIPSGPSSPWTESGSNIYRSSGIVGMGTSNPLNNLDVFSNSHTSLSVSNTSGLSRILLGNQDTGGSNNPAVISGVNGALRFGGGDSWTLGGNLDINMIVSDEGNVVIGNEYSTVSNGLWNNSSAQLVLGGTHNNAFNTGTKAKLVISGYDNDGSTIYPIYLEDENGNKDYYIKNAPSQSGIPTAYYRGNVGIGTETPNAKLEVSGTARITDLAGTGDRMVVADADGDLSTQAIPSGGSSMPNGNNNGDMMYWDGSAWQTIAVGTNGAVLQLISGVPTWVSSPDITGPTITLNGDVNMNVVLNGTFTDPGATTDEGTLTTSGTVDVTNAGTYTITYLATDATGNTATATRTVAVYQSQFNHTGSVQTFTVPAGVTSISVDAYGASGSINSGAYGPNKSGSGGRVQTTLSVSPGEVLNIYIGGKGETYCFGSNNCYPPDYASGGWNGGGSSNNYNGGDAGGGATDIRIGGTSLNDRVIVAGGGGGGPNGSGSGGAGGGLIGGDGSGSSMVNGAGGTQSAGGGGGHWVGGSTTTLQGSFGIGGNGDDVGGNNGGAGGGGWYGGGGSVNNSGGGGGGSSYTHPTLCSSVVHTQGVQLDNGQLIITIP